MFLVSKFKVLGFCVNDGILHFWGSDEILGNAKFRHYFENTKFRPHSKIQKSVITQKHKISSPKIEKSYLKHKISSLKFKKSFPKNSKFDSKN